MAGPPIVAIAHKTPLKSMAVSSLNNLEASRGARLALQTRELVR
jgi:hypothetical protein